LISRIVTGELPVGSILPREEDLADEYRVNRSVVREAGKLLQVHRLVEPRRRRGTEVLDPMQSLTPQVIGALLVNAAGVLDSKFLEEFLEIRALLDSHLAGLVAERRDAGDLGKLEAILERIEAAVPGSDDAYRAVDDFGLCLAQASKNRVFVMLSHWHRQIARRLSPLLNGTRQRAAEVRGYRVLFEVIRGQDSAAARTMVLQFHEWANQQVLAEARKPKTCSR
jgi:DNA-binding FadR family transcriptional regulator